MKTNALIENKRQRTFLTAYYVIILLTLRFIRHIINLVFAISSDIFY